MQQIRTVFSGVSILYALIGDTNTREQIGGISREKYIKFD